MSEEWTDEQRKKAGEAKAKADAKERIRELEKSLRSGDLVEDPDGVVWQVYGSPRRGKVKLIEPVEGRMEGNGGVIHNPYSGKRTLELPVDCIRPARETD